MDSIISLGQKNTPVEYIILSGADNRPPMLDKDLYDSWKSRMVLYMQNREHERMILESVENGPLIWLTVEENRVIRTQKYAELSVAEKIQADCDMKATNIILQGLPADIYSLVNHHRVAKDLWERVQLLMQGTSLTKQERECKLYDAFDKFTHIKGESLHTYYLRFTQLINDMNIYKMKMEQFQVNTKFLNSLPPEWSKFVTDVKLVKDLHTSNFDQLHAYLEQHELHANEVRIMRERNQDPLAFIANQQMTPPHFNTYQSSYNISNESSNLNCSTSNSKVAYQSPQAPTQLMTESPFIDSGFAVPVFSPGDDPIACLNKAMVFLMAVASLRFPSTNNQLRTSSNLRNQATVQDGRVTVQQVQGDKAKIILILLIRAMLLVQGEILQVDKQELLNATTAKDGVVMSKTHVAMPVIDDEETLILEEESRSKMFEKAKDPEVIAKKISDKPIDYEKLNSLTDDFGKLDVPSKLPKVSLVNASLKKLKFHLTQFDSVVKKRTTPSALEEGEWGFEHTKTVFNNEIIPFLKSLKDIFNVFDKDLLNEITEVQIVFDQMEASVQ
ncbi:hypothetical protein Tco_0762303 [Tanacetum coccineum]